MLNYKSLIASSESSYVYLILNNTNGYFKIGTAIDPEYRLTKLQTGSPDKLTIYHTVEHTKARELEKALHAKFNHKHIRGEWFNLEYEDLKYIEDLTNDDIYYLINTPKKLISNRWDGLS